MTDTTAIRAWLSADAQRCHDFLNVGLPVIVQMQPFRYPGEPVMEEGTPHGDAINRILSTDFGEGVLTLTLIACEVLQGAKQEAPR